MPKSKLIQAITSSVLFTNIGDYIVTTYLSHQLLVWPLFAISDKRYASSWAGLDNVCLMAYFKVALIVIV
jgi:hypothetical protein